jgi:diacylglycerol kinase (ATP)
VAFKKLAFVINPAAGQPKPILHSINNVLKEHDVEWEVFVTTPKHSGAELARRAIDADFDLVVAVGGDGTVKDVIDGIVGSGVPLALLQGGTGNALAHRLKIPVEIEAAVALMVGESTLQDLDLGRVVCEAQPETSQRFVLRSSIGLQHTIMETASRELKDRFGNLAYIMASLQSLTSGEMTPVTYQLAIDGEAIEAQGVTCMIANSAAVGGSNSFEFAPNVDPSDGLLDVFVFGTDLPSVIAAITSALNGDEAAFPQRWKGREITVNTDSKQDILLDGEKFGTPPFTASVEAGALKVLVPKPVEPAKG